MVRQKSLDTENIKKLSPQVTNSNQICEIEIRSNFCYNFFYDYRIFFGKKTPFSYSTKKNKSRLVYTVQIRFTNQNDAKTTNKRSSALFFWNFVWIIFHKPSNRKKTEISFFDNYSTSGPSYKKKKLYWKWKIKSWDFYYISFQLCFDMQVIFVSLKLTEF